MSKYTSPH